MFVGGLIWDFNTNLFVTFLTVNKDTVVVLEIYKKILVIFLAWE